MINSSGNKYKLDGVIWSKDKQPVVLLESKYLRYKKHNRDKGSWTCASHYSLRKTYPSIRKSIAVISGNWSKPSIEFLKSFGIEVHEIPFSHISATLEQYRIPFDWPENNTAIPKKAWKQFNKLTEEEKAEIGLRLLEPIKQNLLLSVESTLKGGQAWANRIVEIELLLKTDRNEYFTHTFEDATSALKFLLDLQVDATDVAKRLHDTKRKT